MARVRRPKRSRLLEQSEIVRLDKLKTLAIIAMFSDDDFLELFVLKGGSALDLIHRVSARASVDIDLSLATDLPFSLEVALSKIERALRTTFQEHDLHVFDVTMVEVPPGLSAEFEGFWGGYKVAFKIIEAPKARRLDDDLEALRRNAILIGSQGRFMIDISKHEFCAPKMQAEVEGFRVYAYTPEMIVAEKLRSICQQAPEYGDQMKSGITPRARDFVDVYTVVTHYGIDMTTQVNRGLVAAIFMAKRVDPALLRKIAGQRSFHEGDFPSVIDTARADVFLHPFEFYFEFVVNLAEALEALWNV